MESILVNARIPIAKKEAATAMLNAQGITTTELINAAYDFLIEHEELPTAKSNKKRTINSFSSFVDESTLDVNWSCQEEFAVYKELIRKGKRADYERLA